MDLVRQFLTGILDAAGAVVEQNTGGLHALLDAQGALQLGLSEEVRVALDTSSEVDGRQVDGRLGSPLVERLVTKRLARPSVTAVALPAELPRSLPGDCPLLLNAVRKGAAEAAREPARYMVVSLRVVLQADEVRSAIESVNVRLADGALVALPPLERGYPISASFLDEPERRRVGSAVAQWLRRDGPSRFAASLDALSRRARRDLERMAEYYAGLDSDMAAAAKRARRPDERARRLAKRATLLDDLAARRAQLSERFRPRLSASVVAATLVETEVVRWTVPVRRRTRDGLVAVLCRAADSAFEGPTCAACGIATLRFYLCDDELHVLCAKCGHTGRLDRSRCPACRPRQQPAPLVLSVDDPTRRLRIGASPT